MFLQFTLNKPNKETIVDREFTKKVYARILKIDEKKIPNIMDILKTKYFHYDFNDEWSGGVTVEKVTKKRAEFVSKNTLGFATYQWMIDSILKDGFIHLENLGDDFYGKQDL